MHIDDSSVILSVNGENEKVIRVKMNERIFLEVCRN